MFEFEYYSTWVCGGERESVCGVCSGEANEETTEGEGEVVAGDDLGAWGRECVGLGIRLDYGSGAVGTAQCEIG